MARLYIDGITGLGTHISYAYRLRQLAGVALAAIIVAAMPQSSFAAQPAPAPGNSLPLRLDETFAADIDQHLQFLEKRDLFSGAVLVAEGDRVVLSRGYGFANREHQVRNQPTTTYRIASITKQFTAAAVLLLQDRGKLRLEDPVSKYLTGLPKEWAPITVRQLLDHTSGVASYTDFVDLRTFGRMSQTPRGIVKLSFDRKPDFPIGKGYRYNNTAYIMAGQLIEQVSGKSYADFIEQDLMRPHGMNASGYAFNDVIIPQFAQGYSRELDRVVPAQYLDMSVPYAGGSLYASTHDLHRWNRVLFGDVRVGHEKPSALLSPTALAAMVAPGKHDYGLGIGVMQTPYGTLYAHSGGMPGVNTILFYEPATALTIVALANSDAVDSEAIANSILRYARDRSLKLSHQYQTASGDASSASEQRALLGRYGDGQSRAGQVLFIDGQLHVVPDGGSPSPLIAVAPLHYLAPATLSDFVFQRDANGAVNSVETQLGGRRVTLKREPTPTFTDKPVYLRGSMNNWGTVHKLIAAGPSVWTARLALAAGPHQFKIASEDWRTIDFGAPSQMRDTVSLGRTAPLRVRGSNLRLVMDDAATVEVRVDVSTPDAPTVTVSKVE